MTNKEKKIDDIISFMDELFPSAHCELNYSKDYELVIAVMLSAQTTDKAVNKVTERLFKDFPSLKALKEASEEDIYKDIKHLGLAHNKAKNVKACSQKLLENFGGIVPQNMEDLQSLPGVGRKSANVIMLEAFHNPQGIAVDTHAKRISNKMGFSNQTEPEKIEQDLLKQIPKEYYYDVNHLFVWHGRAVCDARKPKCEECPVNMYCDTYKKR